jgi:hypothetical protein
VQDKGIVVDVNAFRGVILDDAFFRFKEHSLHLAHLFPCRTAIRKRYANVIPALAIAGDDVQVI